MRLSEEKEYFRIELENISGRTKQLQQTIRAVEMEKSDIQASYREVCCENQRLKGSIENMNGYNMTTNTKIKGLEHELNESRMIIKNMQEKEEQMLYDITQYDNNVSSLSHQLE